MTVDWLPTTLATMGSMPIIPIIAPKTRPPAMPPITPPMIRCHSELPALVRVLVAIFTSFFSPFGAPNYARGAPFVRFIIWEHHVDLCDVGDQNSRVALKIVDLLLVRYPFENLKQEEAGMLSPNEK